MRMTRHHYDGPGSFSRLHEAALAVADCETDADSDPAYHSACIRLRLAALAYAAARSRAALMRSETLRAGE